MATKEDLPSRLHRLKSQLKTLLKDYQEELRKEAGPGRKIAISAGVLKREIENYVNVKEPSR